MNAPLLWILLPMVLGAIGFLLYDESTVAALGGATALVLAILALVIPIDQAVQFGSLALKMGTTLQVFGRSLQINPSEAPVLAILFGIDALWFFGAQAAGAARYLISLGLIISGMLVAALAVQPFLFAALLIEIAVLAAVPLLCPPGQRPGRGVIRFLIYQTLAMPFILFAGWLSAGVEASPSDLSLTLQSTVMLGLGFAFLLAIFPLHSWIPMLMEESSPYAVGFLLWLLPTVATIFGMGFLDRYAWLRSSPPLTSGLHFAGLLMIVTGGIWTAFQRHLGRSMAYAAIAETGFILLALSLNPLTGLQIAFLLLLPRGLGLAVWALSLTTVRAQVGPLGFSSVQGLARAYPLAAAGMILSALSSAGFPLLAGFPPRLALWEGLAHESLASALWMLVGCVGLSIGALRMLAVTVMANEKTAWASKETWMQRVFLGLGILGLFGLGILPQLASPIINQLPALFQHLGH